MHKATHLLKPHTHTHRDRHDNGVDDYDDELHALFEQPTTFPRLRTLVLAPTGGAEMSASVRALIERERPGCVECSLA